MNKENLRVGHDEEFYRHKVKIAETFIKRFDFSGAEARQKAGLRKSDRYNVFNLQEFQAHKKPSKNNGMFCMVLNFVSKSVVHRFNYEKQERLRLEEKRLKAIESEKRKKSMDVELREIERADKMFEMYELIEKEKIENVLLFLDPSPW